jgi:hypothetical protein
MKKYIKPTIEVVDMETSDIIAASVSIYKNEESDYQMKDRQRSETWSEYEDC